ncbi:MAG: UDP-glucose 4-epimerase GalE, partial [Gammaproteobacteria bacterium]|nr:UDP-glucose 4-epimerase GalE [Gammaproteobacteria bacterium]
MNVLLAGGAGYIGSHTAVALLKAGYKLFILDNLSNSRISVLETIKSLSGKDFIFEEMDLRNYRRVVKFCARTKIDVIVHLAGLKSVGESVKEPLPYYENNILSSINLCKTVSQLGIRNFIFSSSATVYGKPERLPIDEECCSSKAISPYGRTKVAIEQMLMDLQTSNKDLRVVSLRYFNPAGAHPSGFLGESPKGAPNNLIPILSRVAAGEQPELVIYGDDYLTHDGTCIRDYLHIQDLAEAHVAAVRKIPFLRGWKAFNLGIGKGYSVKEVLGSYEKAAG